jgi:SulP family sulfate permease
MPVEGMMTRQDEISGGLQELHPRQLIPTLVAALVSCAVGVMISISFVALIFCGELNRYVPFGIGIVLFSMIALRVVTSLLSSFPSIIADVDTLPSAILAIIVTSINHSMPTHATSTETFLTITCAIALTSVLTGLFLLVLGQFKVGELIRYMPYPVVGGFLAGTGWLLVEGAIQVMTDVPINISNLTFLFEPNNLIRWLPGFIFAILLLGISRRWNHSLILPVSLAGAIALFYGFLLVTGTSVAEARAHGWLLGLFPDESLWQPLRFSTLSQANWKVILDQINNMTTIMIFSAPLILLAASGLELVTERYIDLNRELKAAGFANIVSGLGGGMVGYHTVSDSTLVYRMGAKSRLVGLCTAALCAVVLVNDASFLTFFPKPVLGGLLIYLGLSFLADWIYDGWLKLSKKDFFLIVLILIVIDTVGFLQGVGVGLLVAAVLFIFEYSRKTAIQCIASGANRRSHIDRSPQQEKLLAEQGDQIYILGLRDYIFFGTANCLLDEIHQRLNDAHLVSLRFVVIDFQNVIGLDSSAVMSFSRLKKISVSHGFQLIFVALQPAVSQSLVQGDCLETDGLCCQVFPDMNRGLEWCEEQILKTGCKKTQILTKLTTINSEYVPDFVKCPKSQG